MGRQFTGHVAELRGERREIIGASEARRYPVVNIATASAIPPSRCPQIR